MTMAPMGTVPATGSQELRSPSELRRRVDRLLDRRNSLARRSIQMASQFQAINAFLELAPQVTQALERLSEQLFQQLLGAVQEKLTLALQEVLEQPIVVKAEADFKRGAAVVDFSIRAGRVGGQRDERRLKDARSGDAG
jgi:hypothetical protein